MRLLLLLVALAAITDAGFLDFLSNLSGGSSSHGGSSSSPSNLRGNRGRKRVSDDDAKKYLNNFGYVGVGNSLQGRPGFSADLSSARDFLKGAIIKFQEFAGLRKTGELDDATKEKMAEPRCGMMDVAAVTDGGAAFKWKKTSLTYSIENYSSDLPKDQVRRALSEAYQKWAAVTPLEFREVASGGDIKVRFGTNNHGDPWPFDGNGGVLAHATMPESGILHFDDDENWAYRDAEKIGNDYTDLLAVAIHEGGHAIGLSHSRDKDDIMAPFYQSTVDSRGNYKEPQLKPGDIQAIQDIYGPRRGGFSSGGSSFDSGFGGSSGSSFGTTQRPATTTSKSHWWNRLFGDDEDGGQATTTWRPQTTTTRWGSSGGSGSGSGAWSGGSGDCPSSLDAITSSDTGSNYIFQGSKVYELSGRRVSKVYSLRQLFPSSPAYVQAAMFDSNSGLLMLFSGGQVYGYYYSRLRGGFTLDAEYPKRLPAKIFFTPSGAMRWIDGRQLLLSSGNDFSIYDEFWNQSTLEGRLSSYYPNLPNGIKGALTNSGSVMTIFTSSEVYDYDSIRKNVGGRVRLSDWISC
ncbi:unnamed protein product, partial [Mesorhabditis spiculigera]